MEIKRLDTGPQDEVVIFCPLENGYKITVGGKEYNFEPFQLYRVDRKFARDLLTRAKRAYEMREHQRALEREEWGRRVSSTSAYVRDSALQYCDEEGNPRSPRFENVPLLGLDTPEGKVEFEKWRTKQLGGGVKEVSSVSVEPPPQRATSPDGVGDGTNPDERVEVEKPDPNWDWTQKYEYVKRWSEKTRLRPRATWIHNKDMHEKLDAAVERTYEILCQVFNDGVPIDEGG